jgi:hypothetical protein
MDRTGNLKNLGMLAGRTPPNGRTLALLCLKFVKHRDKAKIRQKSRQPVGKAQKSRHAAIPGVGFHRPPGESSPL